LESQYKQHYVHLSLQSNNSWTLSQVNANIQWGKPLPFAYMKEQNAFF